MQVSVSHSVAILSLQTHIIHWKKFKKINRKMYSQINYIKQDSTKSHPTVSKTNRVSKYTLSVLKLCYSQHKYRDSSKKILSFHYFSPVLEK